MKTSHIVIILGIIITNSVIFGVTFKIPLGSPDQISFEFPFREEYYEIEITGMKDIYRIGEQYDFSYIISGYGYSCGSKEITFPDQNGNTMKTISLLPLDLHIYEMDCDFSQRVEGESADPISLQIEKNTNSYSCNPFNSICPSKYCRIYLQYFGNQRHTMSRYGNVILWDAV